MAEVKNTNRASLRDGTRSALSSKILQKETMRLLGHCVDSCTSASLTTSGAGPMQRRLLKLNKMISQKGLCAECGKELPKRGSELDRGQVQRGANDVWRARSCLQQKRRC